MQNSKIDIRCFRSTLRQLERITKLHSKNCCSKVSLSQCHVLLQINAEKATTTSKLAGSLNLDASTISRTVNSLVKLQLVTRTESPKDRRSIVLHTTPKGKDLAREINSDADSYFAGVLNCIEEKQQMAVLRNFESLVDAFLENEKKRRSSSSCECGNS